MSNGASSDRASDTADRARRPTEGGVEASALTAARGVLDAAVIERTEGEDTVVADFGQRAIGGVAPVDAALWWLLTLRAYGRSSGDGELAQEPSVRAAIERILDLYLEPRFEMTPALLVPDGAYAIDRRMGVYGHPLDVQVLFFGALRAARELLPADHAQQGPLATRLELLGAHVRTDYWLDAERLNAVNGYGVEELTSAVTSRGARADRFRCPT